MSNQPVVLLAWLISKFTNGMQYTDGALGAIAMGFIWGTGRAVCAGLGAAIVTISVVSPKPQRWAWIVALLYVVAGRPRYHYFHPPTSFDRVSQAVNLLWPAIACIAVASIVVRFRRNSRPARRNEGTCSMS